MWLAEWYANLPARLGVLTAVNYTYHLNLVSDAQLPVIILASFCRKLLPPSSEEFSFIRLCVVD